MDAGHICVNTRISLNCTLGRTPGNDSVQHIVLIHQGTTRVATARIPFATQEASAEHTVRDLIDPPEHLLALTLGQNWKLDPLKDLRQRSSRPQPAPSTDLYHFIVCQVRAVCAQHYRLNGIRVGEGRPQFQKCHVVVIGVGLVEFVNDGLAEVVHGPLTLQVGGPNADTEHGEGVVLRHVVQTMGSCDDRVLVQDRSSARVHVVELQGHLKGDGSDGCVRSIDDSGRRSGQSGATKKNDAAKEE